MDCPYTIMISSPSLRTNALKHVRWREEAEINNRVINTAANAPGSIITGNLQPMIGLSESQLEVIMRVAAPLSEGKCQEFLERVAEAVAVVLQMHGQINDADVAVAVQLALRSLTYNSATEQNRNRNRLPTPRGGARHLPSWPTKLRNSATSFFAGALAWGARLFVSNHGKRFSGPPSVAWCSAHHPIEHGEAIENFAQAKSEIRRAA